MEQEYVYETRTLSCGRQYEVRRKAKRVTCWDCGVEWLIRKDRKTPQYCRVCAVKDDRNPQYGKEAHNAGIGTFDKKAFNRTYQNQRRWDRKRDIVKHMGNKCARCGEENLPLCVWQWHHTNPEDKEIALSQILTHNWTTILEEAEKCELVCSNCHKIIHYGDETVTE